MFLGCGSRELQDVGDSSRECRFGNTNAPNFPGSACDLHKSSHLAACIIKGLYSEDIERVFEANGYKKV